MKMLYHRGKNTRMIPYSSFRGIFELESNHLEKYCWKYKSIFDQKKNRAPNLNNLKKIG